MEALRKRLPRQGMTTAEVCEEFIKPATARYRCRYADLASVREEDAVGDAVAFMSHCWGGVFADLVAAAKHVLPPDAFVWVDIFAVNQHTVTDDLDFVPVVQGCGALDPWELSRYGEGLLEALRAHAGS